MSDDPRFNFGRRWAVNPVSPFTEPGADYPQADIDFEQSDGSVHYARITVVGSSDDQSGEVGALRLAQLIADYLNDEGET